MYLTLHHYHRPGYCCSTLFLAAGGVCTADSNEFSFYKVIQKYGPARLPIELGPNSGWQQVRAELVPRPFEHPEASDERRISPLLRLEKGEGHEPTVELPSA